MPTAAHDAPRLAPRRALHRRPLVRALLVAVALVVAGGWYAFRPDRLFTTRTVSEAAPVAARPAAAALANAANAASASSASSASSAGAGSPMAGAPGTAATGPAALARGRFHSNAHETVGTAAVLDLGEGRRVLRLTGFHTSNGPDVRVILVAAPDVADDATATRAGYVELGALKGTRGDQNYAVPASLDLATYRTVTIWCERFDVNFGSAPLSVAPPSSASPG